MGRTLLKSLLLPVITEQQKVAHLANANKNVIYKTSITSGNKVLQYIGFISRKFKTRFNEYKATLPSKNKNIEPNNCTELTKYLWNLNNQNKQYEISGKLFTLRKHS